MTLETHEEEEEVDEEDNFTSDTQQRHGNSWAALFLKVKSFSLDLHCVRIHRNIRRVTFHTAAQLLVDVLGRVRDAGRGHSAAAARHIQSVITAPESGDTTCGHRPTGRWWAGPRPGTCYWRLVRPMRAQLRCRAGPGPPQKGDAHGFTTCSSRALKFELISVFICDT